jgi:hypothetical protein
MRIGSRLTPKLDAGDLLRSTRRNRQDADNDVLVARGIFHQLHRAAL